MCIATSASPAPRRRSWSLGAAEHGARSTRTGGAATSTIASMGHPSAVFTFSSSRRCRRGLRSRCEDSNSAMGGLRHWTTSPYPGCRALCRGDHELSGVRQPILPPWSYYSWVFGRTATPVLCRPISTSLGTVCGITPIQTIPWAPQWGGEGLLRGPVPSLSMEEGRCFRSDFLEEIRPKGVKVFIVGMRIEQPRGRRDTTQERIAVLWGETKACDLMPIAHSERRDRYHRLVEQTSKIAMIAPERENRTRHGFMGQGHIGVYRQFLDNVDRKSTRLNSSH